MKKISVRSAVPVTTRDTSHSVTDDGTVGLCHADPPRGRSNLYDPFPWETARGHVNKKSEFKRKKSKKSIERMK